MLGSIPHHVNRSKTQFTIFSQSRIASKSVQNLDIDVRRPPLKKLKLWKLCGWARDVRRGGGGGERAVRIHACMYSSIIIPSCMYVDPDDIHVSGYIDIYDSRRC